MTSAQKENLVKLHRLAAYWERAYQTHVAIGGSEDELSKSREAWDAAELDLATYREYLSMLKTHKQGFDGRE